MQARKGAHKQDNLILYSANLKNKGIIPKEFESANRPNPNYASNLALPNSIQWLTFLHVSVVPAISNPF